MKILFKITFKTEVVTALLEYNCFDFSFQVLFVIIAVNITTYIIVNINAF